MEYLAKHEAIILDKDNTIQALEDHLRISQSSLDALIVEVGVAEESRDAAEAELKAIKSQVEDAEAKMAKEKEDYRRLREEKEVLECRHRERVRNSNEILNAESAAEESAKKLQHQRWAREITPGPLVAEKEKESTSSGLKVLSWFWRYK
jgi:multidrug resistance efflux pump